MNQKAGRQAQAGVQAQAGSIRPIIFSLAAAAITAVVLGLTAPFWIGRLLSEHQGIGVRPGVDQGGGNRDVAADVTQAHRVVGVTGNPGPGGARG